MEVLERWAKKNFFSVEMERFWGGDELFCDGNSDEDVTDEINVWYNMVDF